MDRASGIPLHARTRTRPGTDGTDGTAGTPAGTPVGTAVTECPVRHCWVNAPVDGGRPRPGLLLEWRKDDLGQWEGRVAYAAELRAGRWATVEEWLSAELLSTA